MRFEGIGCGQSFRPHAPSSQVSSASSHGASTCSRKPASVAPSRQRNPANRTAADGEPPARSADVPCVERQRRVKSLDVDRRPAAVDGSRAPAVAPAVRRADGRRSDQQRPVARDARHRARPGAERVEAEERRAGRKRIDCRARDRPKSASTPPRNRRRPRRGLSISIPSATPCRRPVHLTHGAAFLPGRARRRGRSRRATPSRDDRRRPSRRDARSPPPPARARPDGRGVGLR